MLRCSVNFFFFFKDSSTLTKPHVSFSPNLPAFDTDHFAAADSRQRLMSVFHPICQHLTPTTLQQLQRTAFPGLSCDCFILIAIIYCCSLLSSGLTALHMFLDHSGFFQCFDKPPNSDMDYRNLNVCL